MKENNTQIVYLSKPQGAMMKNYDPYSLFQGYFKGKYYDLISNKD